MCMTSLSDTLWMLAAHGAGVVVSFIPAVWYVRTRTRRPPVLGRPLSGQRVR